MIVCAVEVALVSKVGNSLFQEIYTRLNLTFVAASGGLQIFETSDPNNPLPLSFINLPGWFTDVKVSGDYAFVSNENGLVSIDISDPSAPVTMGEYKTKEVNYYIAHAADGLVIVDVSDRSTPVVTGSFD
ncbi:hypothetical protein [Aurantivibrio plasticivorans]